MTSLLAFMKSQMNKQYKAKSIEQLRADALTILFITEGHESLLSAAENFCHVSKACPEAFEGPTKLSELRQRMDKSLEQLVLMKMSVTLSTCMQSMKKEEARQSALEQRIAKQEVTRARRAKPHV